MDHNGESGSSSQADNQLGWDMFQADSLKVPKLPNYCVVASYAVISNTAQAESGMPPFLEPAIHTVSPEPAATVVMSDFLQPVSVELRGW